MTEIYIENFDNASSIVQIMDDKLIFLDKFKQGYKGKRVKDKDGKYKWIVTLPENTIVETVMVDVKIDKDTPEEAIYTRHVATRDFRRYRYYRMYPKDRGQYNDLIFEIAPGQGFDGEKLVYEY